MCRPSERVSDSVKKESHTHTHTHAIASTWYEARYITVETLSLSTVKMLQMCVQQSAHANAPTQHFWKNDNYVHINKVLSLVH